MAITIEDQLNEILRELMLSNGDDTTLSYKSLINLVIINKQLYAELITLQSALLRKDGK